MAWAARKKSRVLRGGGQNRGTGDHLEPDVLEEEPNRRLSGDEAYVVS